MDIKTKKQIAEAASGLIHGFSVPGIHDAAGWAEVRHQADLLSEHADALLEANTPAPGEVESDGGEES